MAARHYSKRQAFCTIIFRQLQEEVVFTEAFEWLLRRNEMMLKTIKEEVDIVGERVTCWAISKSIATFG
jgi:hypothetical protein